MGAVSSDATHATERDCRKHGKRDICSQINAYEVYGFESRTFVIRFYYNTSLNPVAINVD